MLPWDWTEDERRAFWIGLWANMAIAIVGAVVLGTIIRRR